MDPDMLLFTKQMNVIKNYLESRSNMFLVTPLIARLDHIHIWNAIHVIIFWLASHYGMFFAQVVEERCDYL
jgi:hypothetical protein